MAIDITIDGKPYWNASSYSVAEDGTPLDPADTSGGTGQFQVTLPEVPESPYWRRKQLLLSDGSQGTTVGKVSTVSGDGFGVNITADSRMNALVVTRTAQPYSGSLGGAFTYYFGLVGLTDDIVIDGSLNATSVVFAGWSAPVWDQIKALCASYQVETSLVSNKIFVRPVRGRVAINARNSQESWALDDSNVAQRVEIYYQQGARKTDLAYPLGGWNSDVQAYQVDAGETATFDIPLTPSNDEGGSPLGVSLTSINQPVCVASVARDYTLSSVYSVAGNDGLPIPPDQWAAQGGAVSVEINPDTKSLTLKIMGASLSQYAPYTIGMSSGDNTYYSSLRLVGAGVFYNRQKISFQTGNDEDRAPTEIGATVDIPFLNSYEDAFRAGLWTLAAWTGPKRTISVTTTGINRAGDAGSLAQYTMGEFNKNPQFAGLTMAQFNAAEAGRTMGSLGDELRATTLSRFENQAFGNVAGARVLIDGSYYRVRSVGSITQDLVSYSAEADDIMSDYNSTYSGMTMAQWNQLHADRSMGDFNSRPMLPAI